MTARPEHAVAGTNMVAPTDVPAGARLASADYRIAPEGARPAGPGGMEYEPAHCVGTTKVGHACTAPRAKTTLYCIGHLRSRGEQNG